ncbi:hypothetical protein P886_0738 [Alteromonadaceae bacterium 2753L.S.0a.02]|nr:hypothetical protein P886_0738 [Alteromonadaceae bacterium 2753L.S.0a.02]
MSETTDFHITNTLLDKIDYALNYALNALLAADPLVPFAVNWKGDTTTIERFMQGAYDDSIELAMRNINDADETFSAYCVVWTGYVEADGNKYDAIILEAGERESATAVQLAQPYIQQGDDFKKEGDLLALGETPNLLNSKLNAFTLSSHLIKPAYVSTEGFKMDVASQPYAKMPAAVICMAANLCDGEEAGRITAGIRKLQELESKDAAALSHRVFSVITSMVADGDFKHVLREESIGDMAKVIVEGGAQLRLAVAKGLVGRDHAQAYFRDLSDLLQAVLTDNGKAALPGGSEKLNDLLETAAA